MFQTSLRNTSTDQHVCSHSALRRYSAGFGENADDRTVPKVSTEAKLALHSRRILLYDPMESSARFSTLGSVLSMTKVVRTERY